MESFRLVVLFVELQAVIWHADGFVVDKQMFKVLLATITASSFFGRYDWFQPSLTLELERE